MNERELKELEEISRALAQLNRRLKSLVTSGTAPIDQQSNDAVLSEEIGRLKQIGRQEASDQLETMSHKKLGQLYSRAGGASRDQRKPKKWLRERILYFLYDFQAGHKIMRGPDSGEDNLTAKSSDARPSE